MCLCIFYHLWLLLLFLRKLWNKGIPIRPKPVTMVKTSYEVFTHGTEGYNTFRIPAIVSHNNWIFAFCEGRKDTHLDYGTIDIVLRRGEIKGKNNAIEWEEELIIVAKSDSEYRVMNACPVVDKDGKITVVYAAFPLKKTERDLIVGDKCEERLFCRTSTDNGKDWSNLINITYVLDEFDPKPLLYAPGPGHCIKTKEGRIVVSGNIQYKRKLGCWTALWSFLLKKVAPFYGTIGSACIIYCDDGERWRAGKQVVSATYNVCGCSCFHSCNRQLLGNESQVAEISNGKLYINSRTKEPTRNRQSVITSLDGSVTDSAKETMLYEPSGIPRWLSHIIPGCLQCGGCEGSVLSIDYPRLTDGKSKLLIFSNPANKRKRKNLSVRISKDCGGTWSEPLTLCAGPAAYSDLVSVTRRNNEGKVTETLIGCMYECAKKGPLEDQCIQAVLRKEERGKGKKSGKDPTKYEASCIVLDLFNIEELSHCTLKEVSRPVVDSGTSLISK